MQIPETGPLKLHHDSCNLTLVRTTIAAGGNGGSSPLLWGMVIWVGVTHHLPCQGHQRFQGAHGKIQLTQSLTQSRHLLMWSYRVNTSFWKELPCEGYLLETGTGRVEGRSKSRGRWSNREWIHSNSTGKMQRCCPATAPEHNEEQCSAGSSSLQWDVMENARAGRKEGKQVNYTGKLGQSTPGTL